MTQQTYTLRDIITGALRLIQATDPNQTLEGWQVANGLYTTQELMDSWNIEGALIYAQTISTFPILAQKQKYTIGPQLDNPGEILSLDYTTLTSQVGFQGTTIPNASLTTNGTGINATANIVIDQCEGGQIIDIQIQNSGSCYNPGDLLFYTQGSGNTSVTSSIQVKDATAQTDFVLPARPNYLTFAAFQPSTTTPPIDLKLDIITSAEWAEIVSKQVGSGVPTKIYFDQTFPQGNIYLWNQPNQGGNLVLTYWQPLPSFGLTLDTVFTVTYPPAYMRLLRYELAMNLAPEYGKPVPGDIATIVDGIKRNLNIANTESMRAEYDVPTGSGAYDAVSGTLYK